MKMKLKLTCAVLAIVAIYVLSSSATALADTIITAPAETSYVFNQDYIISGNFVISTLGDNLSNVNIVPTIFDFIGDGISLDSDNTTTVSSFIVSTNATGQIIDWTISIGNQFTGDFFTSNLSSTSIGEPEFTSTLDWTGTWTNVLEVPAAVTPEPNSIFLLGTGVLGMAGIIRRKVCCTTT